MALMNYQHTFLEFCDNYTVPIGVAGDPIAPGRRSGGAVKKNLERLCSRSQLASGDKCQISPR